MATAIPFHLEILPVEQRALWSELASTPAPFVLYGGTALALRLGHRQSVDFDFFGITNFDPDTLLHQVPYLRDVKGSDILQRQANTLSCLVKGVQISFFGLRVFRKVGQPDHAPENRLRVASVLDIAGTKCAVVQKRASFKDYVDIDAILTQTDVTLPQALAAASYIYHDQFNPVITLKALTYFDEPELKNLDPGLKRRLVSASKSATLEEIENERQQWR